MLDKFLKRDKEAAPLNVKTWFRATVCLASLAAILRTVAYFTSFDSEIGYFNESFFVTLVNWLIVVTCAFALSGFIFISKDADLSHKIDNSANSIFFSATFAGFIMLADFAYKLFTIIGEEKFSYYKMIFSSAYRSDNAYIIRVTAIIEIFGILASVLSAVCFFVRSSKNPKAKLSAWLGFFPIIRALVGVAQMYFDMTVQMNHPSKLMLQFALIAVMFYFLCEEREYVSPEHARPRRFFISGCLAYFLAFAGGFSEIIGFFTGKLSEGAFCVEAFFCFILSFYILARTNSFVRCMNAQPKTEAVVEEVTEETAEEEKIDE
ncbi:MAG: hypothetical protein J6S71_05870 [Clostridia bacterium]|nr:hypothetical protein [Clostridia bacterium]